MRVALRQHALYALGQKWHCVELDLGLHGLVRYSGRFDAWPASVSRTWLMRFDKDKYRVSGSAVSFVVMFILVVSNPALNAECFEVGHHGKHYKPAVSHGDDDNKSPGYWS
jgi:hypothetical protein